MQNFCNLYVIYHYKLQPNYSAEGGFVGIDPYIEARNGRRGKILFGINAETDSIKGVNFMRQVLGVWYFLMSALLSYNWREKKSETVKQAWECFCTMRNLLLNVLPYEEIEAVLELGLKNPYFHF